MASEVSICNIALQLIKHSKSITSLTSGTKEANACEAVYDEIVEATPLLLKDGRFSTEAALRTLTGFVLFWPVLLGVLLWRARDDRDRVALGVLATWSIGLLAAVLLQRRFQNSASVAIAITLGVAGARAWGLTRERTQPLVWAAGLFGIALAADTLGAVVKDRDDLELVEADLERLVADA